MSTIYAGESSSTLTPANKRAYGLKSTNRCEPVPELAEFEDKLFEMTKNVKFREVSNTFQNQLRSDIKKMKKEPKIFMKADKTTNYYKVEIDKSEEMIEKEVHKDYKKATPKLVEEIRTEAVSLATELGVEDRIFTTSKNETYNTIKDHKEDFRNNPKCRQVNPCKPDLGKVSKCRLEEIAEIVAVKSGLTQFKNTQGFLSWYNNLSDKSKGSFYQLDKNSTYPSLRSYF